MAYGQEHIRNYIATSAKTVASLERHLPTLQKIGQTIVTALQGGKKLISAGNGGSAAEALHLAEELTGKYARNRRALPGICISADATAMTCIANDWDFQTVFSRQVEALGQSGDVLVLFTTSGNSENCIRAAAAMKKIGGTVIGLLGKGGGKIAPLCDIALIVDSDVTNYIQEAHQVVVHLILEQVDSVFAT
jgi:D-sedoheptulose 7-phosphate isomerase